MKTIEFEIERTIEASVEDVFARLVDIEGHNDWMPKKGSMRKRTTQTSPGEPTVGTTYVDDTTMGSIPGELLVADAPHEVVYHWWEKSKKGKLQSEGWPAYRLQSTGDGGTLVRHHATLQVHGFYQLLVPVYRVMAVKERTVTVDALKASFENSRTRVE